MTRVTVLATNVYYIKGELKHHDVCEDCADKWTMVAIDAEPAKGFQTMLFTGLTKEQIVRDWPLAYMRHLRHKLDFELGNFMLDLFYYTHRESYAQAVHKMLNSERERSKYTGKKCCNPGV